MKKGKTITFKGAEATAFLDAARAGQAPSVEGIHLMTSPIACAVSDAWRVPFLDDHVRSAHPGLAEALDRLEGATRGSALRKVRP